MTDIRTTHVGSLPRSAAVTEVVFAKERDEPVEAAVFDATIAQAVEEVVARQVAAGVDVVSDGEMSKISYATYIKDRITGFAGDSPRRAPADLEAFPSFLRTPGERRRDADVPPAPVRRRGAPADPRAPRGRPSSLRRGPRRRRAIQPAS